MNIKFLFASILVLGFIFLISSACFANEQIEINMGSDYLISTDKNITSSFVSDNSIVTLSPFFNIFNEKNVLLLHPRKEGKTKFSIFIGNDDNIFDVTVKPNSTKANDTTFKKGVFEIMLLDSPPNIPNIKKEVK